MRLCTRFISAFSIIHICLFLSCLTQDSTDPINKRIFFIGNRNSSDKEYDLFYFDLEFRTTVNLTEKRDDLILRSNSSPKYNHRRNSVFFISSDRRNLMEFSLETLAVKEIIEINYNVPNYIFSPDGHSIVYTERVESRLQLFKLDIATENKQNLSNNPFNNFEASYSRDGTQIVYVCDQDGSDSIAIMNEDGSDQRLLTNSFGDDRYPSFSPDNQTIVFSSSRGGLSDTDYDLYTIDHSGRNFKLFNDSNGFDTQPIYSPDNKILAFLSNRRGSLFRDIFIAEIKTGDVKPITYELKYFNQNHMFSEDGQSLVFENMDPSNSEIMIYWIGEQRIENLTNHPSRDMSPSF